MVSELVRLLGSAARPVARARPKSISFAPLRVSITLPGFRSRWTIPRRCAVSSASAIWIATRTCSAGGSGPFARRAVSVSPSINSITR